MDEENLLVPTIHDEDEAVNENCLRPKKRYLLRIKN